MRRRHFSAFIIIFILFMMGFICAKIFNDVSKNTIDYSNKHTSDIGHIEIAIIDIGAKHNEFTLYTDKGSYKIKCVDNIGVGGIYEAKYNMKNRWISSIERIGTQTPKNFISKEGN